MTGGTIFILAKKKNKSVNIKRYKAKKGFNIGIFLFAVVFIYLIVTVTAYLLEDKPSIYEVREGSIVKDNNYTGLIIRQETTVNAESSGYINYYQNGNSKVKYGAPVYAYLRTYRLQIAEKLLREGNLSVGEIATEIGYTNPNKFTSAFRGEYGMTPTEYKKNV